MKVPDVALFIMLAVFGLIFGGITIGLLIYFCGFVIELAKSVGVWVLFFGTIVLAFTGIQILAMHIK